MRFAMLAVSSVLLVSCRATNSQMRLASNANANQAPRATTESEPDVLDPRLCLALDMTGTEYTAIFDKLEVRGKGLSLLDDDPLKAILTFGKRNIDWFVKVNEGRATKLEMSTPATQRGIPIDRPYEYSRASIVADFEAIKRELPASVLAQLTGDADLPNVHGMPSDNDYLTIARRIDAVYQYASRWLLFEPSLNFLAERARLDVRGYYNLSKRTSLEHELASWQTLDPQLRTQLGEWLKGMCFNSAPSRSVCDTEFTTATQMPTGMPEYYARYLPASKAVWDSYFSLQNARNAEVSWAANDPVFNVPLLKPDSEAAANWLKTNVEDEWHGTDWRLNIDFGASGIARLILRPGETPQVNGVGGNIILMDSNRSLEEYTSRWIIRHEFGHVLGFPDCYNEFYDTTRQVIVSYQIDTSNVMCSRTGHIQAEHYKELRRAYTLRTIPPSSNSGSVVTP